ncbi:MAG: L-serine ammonia-lyase, iron-sulfur-dependent, subunit alpha [Eggerthella lenta]
MDAAYRKARGESIGGGAAVIRKIDDIDVRITGESTSIVVRQRDETGVLAHIAQSISDEGVNIATTRMYRERKGDIAYTVLETDQEVDGAAKAAIEDHPAILDVRVIPGDARPGCGSVDAPGAEEALQRFAEADFGTGAALLAWCEKHGTTLSEAFLAREAALAESLGYADRSLAYLHETLDVMKCAAQRPIDEALPSMGGLIGGEARKLADLRERDGELCDDQLSCAIAYAMAVLETNASMGRIVAAPTAGSSGVLPGVLLALQRTRGLSDGDLARGGGRRHRYLGAQRHGIGRGRRPPGGSAAAMAAAASVELMGGTPAQCFAAASNALTNMMGLVCDPIAGLVEEPCQKRNAAGAAVALVSAQIALAGIGNLVDFDQTVEAMRKVGRSLPFELRESALGGIAAAPTACAYCPGCN